MISGTRAILDSLAKRESLEGALPRILEFYRELLAVQLAAETLLSDFTLSNTSMVSAEERIREGLPILVFRELTRYLGDTGETFREVAAVFSRYPDIVGQIHPSLASLEENFLLMPEQVIKWLEGGEIPPFLEKTEMPEMTKAAMMQATVKPLLATCARLLLSNFKQETWRQSKCPVCGGRPDLAFLDKQDGARWLICSRCDANWLFQRLQCPFCGTQDQATIICSTDNEGKYRLYLCQRCRHYLKAIDLRLEEGDPVLPMERLLTLDLDRQARELGYVPGSVSE